MPVMTKRAAQAAETKKRIIREMKKLIRKKGFENTSVKEISEKAGITVGTFYYYFPSKEDLLVEFLPKAKHMEKIKKHKDNI